VQLKLKIVRGGSEDGRRFYAFAPGRPVSIGRSPENDVPLGSKRASRRHCRLEFHTWEEEPGSGSDHSRCFMSGWLVRDLGSKAGTTVEHVPVEEPVLLKQGDVLRVGGAKLIVELELPAPGGAPRANRGPVCRTCSARAPSYEEALGLLEGSFYVCRNCLLGGTHVDTVAGYRLFARLSKGATGSVHLAVGPAMDRLLALKLVDLDPLGDPADRAEAATRFRREVRLLSEIDHPAILKVFDHGEHPRGYYLAMELLEGDLLALLQREGPVSIPRAVEIARDLAGGLAEVHRRGAIHRDVKPQNVLLDALGTVRLGDFGLTKGLGDTQLTASSMAMGTLYYCPPEQLEDAGAVDARADVYGLGATLYHALTGLQPFAAARSFMEIAHCVLEERLPSLREARPEVPADLARALDRCLAKDPAERFQTAGELHRVLEAIAARYATHG